MAMSPLHSAECTCRSRRGPAGLAVDQPAIDVHRQASGRTEAARAPTLVLAARQAPAKIFARSGARERPSGVSAPAPVALGGVPMTSNRKSLRTKVLTAATAVAPALAMICLAPAAYANASGDIPITFHDQAGQVDRITDLVEVDASSDSTPAPSEAVDADI